MRKPTVRLRGGSQLNWKITRAVGAGRETISLPAGLAVGIHVVRGPGRPRQRWSKFAPVQADS